MVSTCFPMIKHASTFPSTWSKTVLLHPSTSSGMASGQMLRLFPFAYERSILDLVHPLSTCAETCIVPPVILIEAGRWKAFGFCLLTIRLICGSSCSACKALSSGIFLRSWTKASSIFLEEPGAHTFNWVKAILMGLSLTCLRTHLSEKGLSSVNLVVSLGDIFVLDDALLLHETWCSCPVSATVTAEHLENPGEGCLLGLARPSAQTSPLVSFPRQQLTSWA